MTIEWKVRSENDNYMLLEHVSNGNFKIVSKPRLEIQMQGDKNSVFFFLDD